MTQRPENRSMAAGDKPLSSPTRLEQWFLSRGGRMHPEICISYRKTDGRGYRLEQRGDADVVTAIPDAQVELVFTPSNICFSFLHIPSIAPWWPSVWIDGQSPAVLTRFLLIESLYLGERCEFFPYIQCLPRRSDAKPFNTPLYWAPEEREFLHGTNLFFAWEKRSDQWRGEFKMARADLAALCPEHREHIEQFEEKDYIWAATVLTSRCFPGTLIPPAARDAPPPAEGSESNLTSTAIYNKWLTQRGRFSFPILIPVLDLANHSPTADVTWDARDDGVGLKTDLPGHEGAEVFNNYGQKSNEELILGYGFDLLKNSANHFGLSLPVGGSQKLQVIAAAESSANDSTNASASIPHVASSLQQDPGDANMSHLGPRIYVLREYTHPLDSSAATPLARLAMNSRELYQQCESPQQPPLLKLRFPTRLGVVCASQFHEYLRQKSLQISTSSEKLPDAEQISENQTMQMAKRYRDSQLSIAADGIAKCSKSLSDWKRTGRLLSLDAILTGFTPPDLLRAYRKTIHRALGTRKTHSIQNKGQEELAFVLWILNLARGLEEQGATEDGAADQNSDGPKGLVSKEQLRGWINHLARSYGLACGLPTDRRVLLDMASQACWDETAQASAAEAVAKYEGYLATSDSSDTDVTRNYLLDIDDTALSVSLHDILAWAVRVVREEGVEIPADASGPTADQDPSLGELENATHYVLVFEEQSE